MPMTTGSVFAYDPTHSMATKGATRQRAMTTRKGVTTGPLPVSGACDMDGSVPSLITGGRAQEI
ncbi:hypothetical protein GCM10019016_081970 [Streptomyces prasinosporus]|uniref:ATP-grasp-modified RiPP n=1 Tax=Streptomyces prasinosporus TaxID=68256 RepID=A0ABP6U1S9_9ACTN